MDIGIAGVDTEVCMVDSIVEVVHCLKEVFAGVDMGAYILEAEVDRVALDLAALWGSQMARDTADLQYPLTHPMASRVTLGIPVSRLEGVEESDGDVEH